MIEIIETSDGLTSLESVWKDLEKNERLRVFQTYNWCFHAWDKILSKDTTNLLWVVKWTQDDKRDVVIFPFYIDGNQTLRFILDVHNDNNDAVYSGDPINRHWVYREVADAIMRESRIKRIWLQKMRGDSEAMNHLAVFLPGVAVSKDNAFAYIRVDTVGDFVASQCHLRSEGRKHVRKLLKQAEMRDYVLLRKDSGNVFPRGDILALRDEMIRSGNRAMGFVTDAMIDLAGEMYEVGACEIPVFRQDGRIISMEFRLLKGDYSLDWIYLTEDPRTGTEINVKYCVERAKNTTGIIDFGVGAYEYKILTTRPMMGVTFSLRFGKTFGSHTQQLWSAGIRMLKDFVKARRK